MIHERSLAGGVILFGLPLEKSENGFIAIETGRFIARVEVEDCPSPRVIVEDALGTEKIVREFVGRLLKELGLNLCVQASGRAWEGVLTRASVYAGLTSAIFEAVAAHHGEAASTCEIIEYSSMLDDIGEPSWQGVVSALRFNSLKGGATVFRNIDECFQLVPKVRARVSMGKTLDLDPQMHNEKDLGPDLYGSLIHTVGILVLEASVRIRDADGMLHRAGLFPLLELQKSLAEYFWAYRSALFPSPGLPRQFHELYLEV
ncbi:MAG: hypothetical protein F7C34_01190 [Desulfurococcales archaeon]|nr:hypothetical protein [Desulfurococcales archaeon]